MVQDELAEDVRKVIAEHITSVEQLEILLLLRSQPETDWTARKVSEEMRTSEWSAAARLAELQEHGLLASRDEASVLHFRFEPSTEWLRDAVERVAIAYAQRRYTVIELIFSKPIEKLRVYADAFRFRKDPSDG